VADRPSPGSGEAADRNRRGTPPAPGLTHFRLADLPAQPWKNGGGLTREIACWPPGAGLDDFLWRISVARIDAGGPFSRFAGVDRVITLLSGPGVVLRGDFPAGEHALTRPLAPFAFPGDVDIDCVLQGGASEDFNVMSRRGPARTRVTVIRDNGELPPAAFGLLMAVGGTWEVNTDDGARHVLAPCAGLWWAGAVQRWRVRGGAPEGDAPETGLLSVDIEIPSPNDGADGNARAQATRDDTRGQEPI